jgi:hypothetical protein
MLHVYRMTAKDAQDARSKGRRQHQKQHRTRSEKTLCLRQGVLGFPSRAWAGFSGEMGLALSRGRWQIEVAIKRLKRLIHINKLRAKRGRQLAEGSLYGKVLSLRLVDQARRTPFGHAWGRWAQARQGTWWRLSKLVTARLAARRIARWHWRHAAVPAGRPVLMERPRKRTLQRLPRRGVALQQSFATLPDVA